MMKNKNTTWNPKSLSKHTDYTDDFTQDYSCEIQQEFENDYKKVYKGIIANYSFNVNKNDFTYKTSISDLYFSEIYLIDESNFDTSDFKDDFQLYVYSKFMELDSGQLFDFVIDEMSREYNIIKFIQELALKYISEKNILFDNIELNEIIDLMIDSIPYDEYINESYLY